MTVRDEYEETPSVIKSNKIIILKFINYYYYMYEWEMVNSDTCRDIEILTLLKGQLTF